MKKKVYYKLNRYQVTKVEVETAEQEQAIKMLNRDTDRFAKSEDTEETDYELKSIEDEMDKALKKFNDLCWIMIDKSTETFEIMPSLNRLLNMFENYIINTPISNE